MTIRTTLMGAAALATLGAAAEAETARIVVGVPDGSAAHYGVEASAEDLAARTDGELDGRVFPPSLFDLRQTFGGISDGIVDGGYMVLDLFPAELS